MPNSPSTQTTPNESGAVATAVRELLGGVRQGEPMRSGALTLIPLLPADARVKRQSGYLPLEEALRRKLIAVAEQAQAQVPELLATSTAETPVVLVGGEQVVGGLQNRVLNTTILVAAHSDLRIPVTCVEHGRWHETSEFDVPTPAAGGEAPQPAAAKPSRRAFTSDEAGYASLRKMHAKAVTASLATGGGYRSNQGEVWGEVAERMQSARAYSPSGAMYALYNAPERSGKLKEAVAGLKRPEGALGFVAVLGTEVLGAELFTDETLADAYWEKLTRSYAVEALDQTARQGGGAEGETASAETQAAAAAREARLIEDALAADIQVHPSPGLGADARLMGAHVSGAGLVYDGAVVHLSLFPEADAEAEQPRRAERHYGGHRQPSAPASAAVTEPVQRVEPS
jgi:hypothetical protein